MVNIRKPRSTTQTSSTGTRKRIGTHNGRFQTEEVIGCFMLRRTAKYFNADIVRTRDPKVLDILDVVLDIGGVYDQDRDRYDHHQEEFNEVFGHGFTTTLSCAGLIYRKFGKEIITKELK